MAKKPAPPLPWTAGADHANHVIKQDGEGYPFMQWINGSGQGDTFAGRGGFLFRADQDPDFPLGQLNESFTFRSGAVKAMFEIPYAWLVPLGGFRLDWFKQGKGEHEKDVYYPGYAEGLKGHTRVLAFVKGLEEWHQDRGPLMVTIKGVCGKAFSDAFAAFYQARDDMLGIYNARHNGPPMRLADYTFWVPIQPGSYQRAHPNHPSMVTPPTMRLPSKISVEDPDSWNFFYVGDDMLQLAAEHWDEAVAWSQAPVDQQGYVILRDIGADVDSLVEDLEELGGVPSGPPLPEDMGDIPF